MNELTESERAMLDKLNVINFPLVKDYDQSLWNVCWGYLNGKFNDNLILDSESKIIEVLKSVNEKAPKIIRYDDAVESSKPIVPLIPEDGILKQKEDRAHRANQKKETVKIKMTMNTLF